MDREQFFQWLDEWAESRGLLVGTAGEELGDAYDFRAVIAEIFGDRPQGPRMRALLNDAPTRILYRTADASPREDEILKHNRALIESDPKWFVHTLGGGTVVREARDTNGQLIPGLLVVPSVNNAHFGRDQAIEIARHWLTTKANLALNQDNNPLAAHDFD